MDERQKNSRSRKHLMRKGSKLPMTGRLSLRKGGAPKQLYKASLEHPISEDKLRLPGASDEEAGGEASEGGDQAAEEEGRDTKHELQH